MFSFVFLGGPGSGKGTQAKFIQENFSFYYIGVGDILRTSIANKTPLGLRVKNIIEAGILLTDELISEVIQGEIQKQDLKTQFIIDGFPRTKNQAVLLDQIIPKHRKVAISMLVEDSILKERLLFRKKNQSRSDDNEDIILKRIKIYHQNIEAISLYYKKHHYLYEINGHDDKIKIKDQISQYINALLKNISKN